MIRLVLLFLSLLLAPTMSAWGDAAGGREAYICATRTDLVGPCFQVRGRLSFWNGTPSARIWQVGTKHMLGVHHDRLPPTLAARWDAVDPEHRFDTEAWADYSVCPFTRRAAGQMQFVCIDSWSNLSMRQRDEGLKTHSPVPYMLAGGDTRMIGGFGPADTASPPVRDAAEFAVAERAKRTGQAITLEAISAAEQQVVAGMNYRLCLNIKVAGVVQQASVLVFCNLKQHHTLTRWRRGCP